MATQIWSGQIDGNTFRVVDLGVTITPRLQVEVRSQPDLMGGFGWNRFDPIPTSVFSRMLIDAHVVT